MTARVTVRDPRVNARPHYEWEREWTAAMLAMHPSDRPDVFRHLKLGDQDFYVQRKESEAERAQRRGAAIDTALAGIRAQGRAHTLQEAISALLQDAR